MSLARYASPLNYLAVVTHMGLVLRLLGLLFVPSVVVALAFGEFERAGLFAALALGVFAIGWLASLANRPALEVREALVVTALAYLAFSLAGGLAHLPEAPLIDGFFESMSGFTTTGLSTLDPALLPKSLLFFRASTQWVGGAGIIVIALVVLFGPGRAPFKLYAAEFGGENLVGSVVATARVVIKVYLGLTALGYVVFLAVGMAPFDALLNIMTTVSTGGFSPFTDSVGHYQGIRFHVAFMVFMILGAVSFPLYYLALREGPRRFLADIQLRWLLAIVVLAGVAMFGILGWGVSAALPAFFQATSAASGTGFSTVDISSLPETMRLAMIPLMLIGGSVGSTAGGIKLLRFIILAKLGTWMVTRALLPQEAQVPVKYGNDTVSDGELKEMFAFVALFAAIFFGSAMLLALAGFPVLDALFESASAAGTVGLSTGITSPDLSSWAKLVLSFQMWAGRLEVLAVLVFLYPGTWKWARRRG
ncbi:MAG: trk system potassium uptake protein TrkH [Chloroflexi bacterium]|jgi:trk system potassium uptake protein TrkH|nr:MAG: trk system potassium uptake protein TrkH [Chloroflexota bacterium]